MKYFKWLNKDILHAFSLLGHLGIVMVGNILVCIGAYKLIERYWFKSTLLFIALVLLGVASGFYSCYKLIMKK
ncbi:MULTISPECIES: AtpZ/AtpI family protein [unclassified Fusobacterium]|uniref:AtpZ/AtpI family protein n=1 Tax=unclassified Fusobacterium TaxID=2648384 RepID=UPI001B8A954A|nr:MULTISPECIES: AtpZ/AtpI family protein [unclassified Fusobacterium]